MERLEKDKRTVTDRRQRPTRPFSRYMLSGRRQRVRRQTDRKTHLYVDRYSHKLLTPLLLIILLCVLDAHFTMFHLDRGAEEINPLMNLLIKHGFLYFFIVKYLLTVLGVFIFCIYQSVPLMRVGLVSMLVLYLIVFTHHLLWIFRM